MFSDIAEKVRLEAKLRGFSEHTVKTYVRNVELFFESVQKRPEKVNARGRARHHKQQKRKGRRQGAAARKGTKFARMPAKRRWIAKIRSQRLFIKELKTKKIIDAVTFRELYNKAKGGFFRSVRHIKLYLEEHTATKKHETPK